MTIVIVYPCQSSRHMFTWGNGKLAGRTCVRAGVASGPWTMLAEVLHRVVSHSWVYDAVQRLAGCSQSLERLRPYLAETGGQIVLDIGAGTGNYTCIVPSSARYLWFDNDVQK